MKKNNTKLSKTAVSLPQITFSVVSSYENIFAAFSTYFASSRLSKKRRRFYQLYFWVLGIFVICSNVVDLWQTRNFSDIYGIFFGLLLLTPWIYLQKAYSYLSYMITRIGNPVMFSITDKEFTYKNGKFFRIKVSWSNFTKFVVTDDVILCVRPLKSFPMFNLISFIPKKSVEENDWRELSRYVSYKKEILENKVLPRKFTRWSIRILFIIFIELCLWVGYIDALVFFKVGKNDAPFAVPLVILALFIPYYARLIDFKLHSLEKNVLFPTIACMVFLILVAILFILVP